MRFYPRIKSKWKVDKKASCKFLISIFFIQNYHQFYPLVVLLAIGKKWASWKGIFKLRIYTKSFFWTKEVYSILQMSFSWYLCPPNG